MKTLNGVNITGYAAVVKRPLPTLADPTLTWRTSWFHPAREIPLPSDRPYSKGWRAKGSAFSRREKCWPGQTDMVLGSR